MEQFIRKFRESFLKKLERKTNWGRNEIKLELEMAISDALIGLPREQFDPTKE